MTVNYAKSYIDRACESRDVFTLYNIVRTLDVERDLDEPYKLFLRLWEWCCATRSFVWQYYETISLVEFHETASMMDRFKLGRNRKTLSGGHEELGTTGILWRSR